MFNLMRAVENSQYAKEETLLGFIGMYLLSPPIAFCQIPQEISSQFGTNTFESIYFYLNKLGLGNFIVKEKLQEFVYVPVSTNVYTIFQPFYLDFGYRGIAFFAGVYGVLSGILYKLFVENNAVGKCLYTYMIYALVLQFYQENIFLSLQFYIELSFFIFIFCQDIVKLVPSFKKKDVFRKKQ